MSITGEVPPILSQETAPHDPKFLDVIAITREMFPGSAPEIEVMADPEDAEHPFVVVTVEWAGDPRESVEKRLQWHRRVPQVSSGNCGGIRLSMVSP